MTDQAPLIVYFSSVSENTHRFVKKLDLPAVRIPVKDAHATGGKSTPRQSSFIVDRPFVLILPTYGGGAVADEAASSYQRGGGYVPKQVVAFLNNPHNRSLLRAVIAAGNTNFGAEFCRAGDVIAAKCDVPYLYRFELMGTEHDVSRVREGLAEFASTAMSTAS